MLFRSSRFDPEGNFQYLSTLDLDPSTGASTTIPRQVSLEPSSFSKGHQVSPDGQQIVYGPHSTDDGGFEGELKVIPWNGGNARTVWRQKEGIGSLAWPGDGYIYFFSELASADDVAIRIGGEIRRVPAEGGAAEVVSSWPREDSFLPTPSTFSTASVRGGLRRQSTRSLPSTDAAWLPSSSRRT